MNSLTTTRQSDYQLSRNAFGRLVFETANGDRHEGVVAVRAFPIDAPDDGVSLVSAEGHELVWIDRLSDLQEPNRAMVDEELARREFMPVINCLTSVSTFATPSTWSIETNRGSAQFILRGEEDIRRIGQDRLHITDNHGIQYLVPSMLALDAHSRKLLDRFL
jgi:hypothetical protein